MNRISELFDNAIEKKEFRNLKDDVLKLIGNSRICDVKRKDCKKDKEKDSMLKEKAGRKIIIKKKIVMIAKMLIIIMMIMIMII